MTRVRWAAVAMVVTGLAVSAAGCSSSGTGTPGGVGGAAGGNGGSGAGGGGAGGGGGVGGGGSGYCAQGCQHLNDCGLCITTTGGACLSVQDCTSACGQVPTGSALAQCVITAGCDTNAIGACSGPQSGGGGSQCSGCYWDGSACTWCSTSDWGAGPYSGACSSCDASCCPGH